ncbi:MAG: glycosyltransferase family 4 protein, partial [Pirellulales bacterium]|nr:glycosyltransferase family 4 protein [Pirellulales bacterium]
WPHRRAAELVVVGGKHLGRFSRTARRLGVDRRVHFVGAVDDTVPYYAAADVYVHPTFYDPCSLVVLEALASGLPVVTTRQNGASELLVDRRDGVLLDDPADVNELLRRVEPLLEPARRRAMGQAARQLALQHTFSRNIDELVAVYEEIDQRRRRAAEQAVSWLEKPFTCRIRGAADKPIPQRTPSSDTGVPS